MRLILVCLAFISSAVFAQVTEEVVVTGSYTFDSPPAQRLVRRGDNILLKVLITNDAREKDQREKEIHATLLNAIQSASKTKKIELSAVTDSGFVIPLRQSNHRIELADGRRPDTSAAYFRVKAAIGQSAMDGEALVLSLRRFVADLKMEGRTLVFVDGDVEVSIVNPSQYRSSIIDLMAEDVKNVTSVLGGDYRVVLTGIDQPVQWARLGSIDVSIYIPYEYVVLPSTITSYSVFPDF